MNISYEIIMYNTLTSLLIIIVAFGLVSSQTNTTENPQHHPYFTCSSDICNRHGQDQFCSEREKKCRNCQEIADDCLEPELPSKCTRWCINFHIQKALKNEKETACKDIGLIRNGNHNGSLTQPQVPGDVIAINCDPGYQISGSKTLECKVFGQWSHDIPTCQEMKCPVLPSVPNGRHNGSTTIPNSLGDIVSVVCNHGYQRIGQEFTTCNTNGVWNDQLSVCQIIECALPPKFKNGKWSDVHHSQSPRFKVSQTIRATCNEGYNLSGPDTWKCLVTGEWYSHDGLYGPDCIKYDTNICMIVACIEGVLILVSISTLLWCQYTRRCKKRYQPIETRDQCNNDETTLMLDNDNKVEDAERVHIQAKPSPPTYISLHDQRLQRESQSDIKRQRNVSPSIPPTEPNVFNDGKNNCAEVENIPRKSESNRNREYSQNIPHSSNVNDDSRTQRCEGQNVSGMFGTNIQSEDPTNMPSGSSAFCARQRDRSLEQTVQGKTVSNEQRQHPPNITSSSSTLDENHRHRFTEQTIQENTLLNRQTEHSPNIPSGSSGSNASQSDRSEEQIIQGKSGLNRERGDTLNISRQDRSEKQSMQGKTWQNRHREDPPNIPSGSSGSNASQSDRSEEQNIQGKMGLNRERGDSPNIPSESSTVDSSQRDHSEGPNIHAFTLNINLHANNSADNSNRLEYGNKSDSRYPVPKTDNSASQTPQATQSEMDVLKAEDEKSPIEESGKFQPSQPHISCHTKDKLAASRSEHDIGPLRSFDSKFAKEKLGGDGDLINGLDIEQSTNNEQDTVRKLVIPNDDVNIDDLNACVSNKQCGGNEHQTYSLAVPQHSANTAKEIVRTPNGVLKLATDEELDNASGGLITGLAVQQCANNEQDTARKLAMPNGNLNTDDITAHVFNQHCGGTEQMNNVTVPHSANTAQESARMFAMPHVVLAKGVNEELCNANGLAVQQCANNEQDTARKLAMPNGDINADDVKV